MGDHLILSLLAKDILAPALHIAALAQLKVLLETKMLLEDQIGVLQLLQDSTL